MSWFFEMRFFPGARLLCTLLLILIVLQYMFGSVGNLNRRWDTLFSTTPRVPQHRTPFLEILTGGANISSTIYTPSYLEQNTTLALNYLNATTENTTSNSLGLCPPIPPNLEGRVEIVKTPVPTVHELEAKFPWLKLGGRYLPDNCIPRYRVAIIVPYRARAEHLLLFLQHMHQFLKKQQIDYTIFIIEQDGTDPFNRAMLMNVGFKEASKLRPFDCFIFHDVDLLPEDDRNLYTCPEQPRHMSVAVDVFKYKLPYSAIFGGVSALTKEQFQTVNGFSNSFWGWGGEDDDMSNRVKFHNYHISRYPVNIARYTMLTHQKEKANPKRYENLQQGKKKYNSDGLINLKYAIIENRANLLYTWFLVNLRKPS